MLKPLLLSLLAGMPAWTGVNPYATIGAIPAPAGYRRVGEALESFGSWLRDIGLKRDLTVHLYNGVAKRNQDAQFAVLNVSVGHEDLQQCADAVMRLRAEWLYYRGEYGKITFYTERGVRLNFQQWCRDRKVGLKQAGDIEDARRRATFDKFLREVFTFCSTRTLEKDLWPAGIGHVEPGDVLIRGGSPGHAMLVVDVAEDAKGHRVFLLAQSYMPAQDIHVVRNPGDDLTPWYRADSLAGMVETPEYEFKTNELRRWRN
jgi:hypothetical protein